MIINHDVIIIGAGAAGLMAAIEAGKRGRTVLLLESTGKIAEKIRISVKYVQNSKYKGDILMYPIDWLDYYFSKKETKQDESDDLPF